MTTTDWQPMITARRDGPVLLWDNGERRGQWDDDRQRWVSLIDPRVTWRPVAWRDWPQHD